MLDHLLEAGQPRTVTETSEALASRPSTVREHLEALVGLGLAERDSVRSGTRGRPAALYRATVAAAPANAEYAVLAEVLVDHLARTWPDPGERAAQAHAAGAAWGRALAARGAGQRTEGQRTEGQRAEGLRAAEQRAARAVAGDRPGGPAGAAASELSAVMAGAGFDPAEVVARDGTRILRLRRCPVLDLARAHPDVVCAAHLGMAREIVRPSGIDEDRVALEAFAEPGACLLSLTPTVGESR